MKFTFYAENKQSPGEVKAFLRSNTEICFVPKARNTVPPKIISHGRDNALCETIIVNVKNILTFTI